MSKEYHGSCHCGAVRFISSGEEIRKGVYCNCSICVRKDALMNTEPISPANLIIEAEDDVLGLYEFGTKTAKHHFCKRCGIYTFHQTRSQPGFYWINIGCIEGIDKLSMERDLLDGKNLLWLFWFHFPYKRARLMLPICHRKILSEKFM